ncbi:MAG: DUF177 domain-containing protein [Acidobacteria bacterium]|nr:DUF177 domain-containing protein [Acidobacteriota bacterium]MDW7985001.1 DUF177 domain-containing protein [Acidobacteriota bacterium]
MTEVTSENRYYREWFLVQTLEGQPQVELRRRVPPERFEMIADDVCLVAPVRFRVRFSGVPQRVRVRGWVRTQVQLQCDRCLVHYDQTIDVRFDSIYLPLSEAPTDSRRLTQPEDAITTFFEQERIDVWVMIHEQILLQVPFKRLCRADCRGICPTCGANRNVETCVCTEELIDPRWEPLARLRRLLSR